MLEKTTSSIEEQCLEMLGTMRVEGGAEMMEVARDDPAPAPDQAQAAAEDDHWLDDQWEDFASLEEENETAEINPNLDLDLEIDWRSNQG